MRGVLPLRGGEAASRYAGVAGTRVDGAQTALVSTDDESREWARMLDWLSDVWIYIAALLPSAGLLYLFYVVMKHIVEGDRRERIAHAQWEAEQDRLDNAESSPSESAVKNAAGE